MHNYNQTINHGLYQSSVMSLCVLSHALVFVRVDSLQNATVCFFDNGLSTQKSSIIEKHRVLYVNGVFVVQYSNCVPS